MRLTSLFVAAIAATSLGAQQYPTAGTGGVVFRGEGAVR